MKKILSTALLLSVVAGTVAAQQKRSVARGEDDRAVSSRMDAHRFYHTPYRSRNNGTYGLDRRILSFGLGFPNALHDNYNYYSGGRSGFGPLMAKFEFAIRDEIGLGAIVDVAYSQYRFYDRGREYRDKALGTGVSFLGYYHFNKLIPVRRLDVYAGLGINFSHVSYTSDYSSNYADNYIDVLPALVAGARYYVTPTFAPYLELGRTNYSYANLGISLNL